MDMISKMQILLFGTGAVIIAFIAIRTHKKDIVDINDKKLHFLKQGNKYPIGEETAGKIKKRRWIWAVFASWIVYLGSSLISQIVVNIGSKPGVDMTMEMYQELWQRQKNIKYGICIVGVLLILAWIIYDVIQTRKPDNKYKVPAYVQSTFTNPKHRTRSAQLMYYDFKQLKCRLRTISITRLERKMGAWSKGDMVYIIVEEGQSRVRFVSALEERV